MAKKPQSVQKSAASSAELMSVADLKSDPRQIRRHTPRNIGMIGDGLQAVGAARSIVIDEDNTILAGNGTIEAASERGFNKVRVIEADGHEIIAVRRRGLTEKQKVELALYDNRASDFAEYDLSALKSQTELVGLDVGPFFSSMELRALTDREMAHEMTQTANTGSGEHAEEARTPTIPDGYVEFALVITEADDTELRAVLEAVKAQANVATLAQALMLIVRDYVARH